MRSQLALRPRYPRVVQQQHESHSKAAHTLIAGTAAAPASAPVPPYDQQPKLNHSKTQLMPSPRIQLVLLLQHPRCQLIGAVCRVNRHHRLRQDRACSSRRQDTQAHIGMPTCSCLIHLCLRRIHLCSRRMHLPVHPPKAIMLSNQHTTEEVCTHPCRTPRPQSVSWAR